MVTRHKSNSRSGGALGVVLLMVAALACAAILAVIVVVKTVRVHSGKQEQVSIDIPGGSFRMQGHKRLDPASLGVPIYPGAQMARKDSGGGASFEWASSDGKSDQAMSISGADYITQDSGEQVLRFYRGKLNNWIFVNKKDGHFDFEHTQGTWKRVVAIHEQSDGTHIGVASFGEPAGN